MLTYGAPSLTFYGKVPKQYKQNHYLQKNYEMQQYFCVSKSYEYVFLESFYLFDYVSKDIFWKQFFQQILLWFSYQQFHNILQNHPVIKKSVLLNIKFVRTSKNVRCR